MPNPIDLIGQEFGKWAVLGYGKNGHWKCRCNGCGTVHFVSGYALRKRKSKSCFKCFQLSRINHGFKNTSTYRTWTNMRQRCNNPKQTGYSEYGGRGIKVCDRWNIFENFIEDMGLRPPGRTLDRINVNDDYTKDNCRWATREMQSNNKRTNYNVTYEGRTQTLTEWCKEKNLDTRIVYPRLRSGWDVEKAFTTPVLKKLLVNGKSVSTWAKELGMSRRTIAKKLGSGCDIETIAANRKKINKVCVKGEPKSINEAAIEAGINPITLSTRLRRGWSDERALSEIPSNPKKFIYNGEPKNLSEMAKILKKDRKTLREKLKKGITMEEFIKQSKLI